MSKVLLTTIDFPPNRGGVARYLWALSQELKDDVHVLHWRNNPGRLEMYRDLVQSTKGYQSIWISHVLPVGTLARIAKLITRRPYVIFLHGMDFDLARRDRRRRFLTKFILRGASRVVTNSQALASEVKAFAGINEPLVVYPVVAKQFVDASMQVHAQPNPHAVTLLTVSRLVERKGHIPVLETIRDMPNVHYTIVGDGPYYRKIFYRIKDLGLETRVRVIRDATDAQLPAIYQSSDIFVMPTHRTALDREGFGIVYLEAQLFGLPVIASNHPGVNEAVLHRQSGLLLNDRSELKNAISALVNDEQARKRMGGVGRDYVLQNFTRDKQFSKLRELL